MKKINKYNILLEHAKKIRGASLVEMLIAIIIVSLSGLLIAGGVTFAASSFCKTSDAANARALLEDYSTAIEHSLSYGKYVSDYSNNIVYENKTFGSAGYCTVVDDEIVFKPVKTDYFGNIFPAENIYKFIPTRNLYDKNGQRVFDSYISIKHKEADGIHTYDVYITVLKDEIVLAKDNFRVSQKGELINY